MQSFCVLYTHIFYMKELHTVLPNDRVFWEFLLKKFEVSPEHSARSRKVIYIGRSERFDEVIVLFLLYGINFYSEIKIEYVLLVMRVNTHLLICNSFKYTNDLFPFFEWKHQTKQKQNKTTNKNNKFTSVNFYKVTWLFL